MGIEVFVLSNLEHYLIKIAMQFVIYTTVSLVAKMLIIASFYEIELEIFCNKYPLKKKISILLRRKYIFRPLILYVL